MVCQQKTKFIFICTQCAQDGALGKPIDQQYVLEPNQDPRLVAGSFDSDLDIVSPPMPDVLATNIAHVAREKRNAPNDRPAPLYIRAADAAPARDLPPKIL